MSKRQVCRSANVCVCVCVCFNCSVATLLLQPLFFCNVELYMLHPCEVRKVSGFVYYHTLCYT